MKTYIFKLQKGGTGATSIGLTVAVELAKAGHKTLFIDADPQGNATTWLNFNAIKYELSDILQGNAKPSDAILSTSQENLFVIPTAGIDGELSKVKDVVTNDEPFIMADICDGLQSDYEYCLIDLSPSYGNFERSCYLASDEILPVLLLDDFSIDGLKIFSNHLQETKKKWRIGNDKMQFHNIVLNKMNKTKSVSKLVLKNFESKYTQENLFVIPQDPNFEKAQLLRAFIQDVDGTKAETLQEIKRLAGTL
ncbi:MAG: ParA family protein [Clostridia bacterium]|nr:ParA family protein [Clostridia bacterium]